jgi:hypothetical protein
MIKKKKERKHTPEEDAAIEKAKKIPGSVLLGDPDNLSIIDRDIEEKTKQILEKQQNCPHLHRSYWLIFDPWNIGLKNRNDNNTLFTPSWYCGDCGKNL